VGKDILQEKEEVIVSLVYSV